MRTSRPTGRSRATMLALVLALAASLLVPTATAGAVEGTRFDDVPASHPFVTEIEWAALIGLVDGYDDGTFGPDRPMSRQAAAAVLHRLAGSPSGPGVGVTPFDDVPDDHRFAAAIGWMAASGLTEGYGDDTFRPTEPVSRQAMAAFLHRAAGPEGVLASRAEVAGFSDVAEDHAFAEEIGWIAAAGIAEGYDDGTFRPTAPVSRQATTAFVRRTVAADLVPLPGAVEPEWFEGSVDDFYLVPDPLPYGPPGSLIRVQAVAGAPAGTTTLRIMYHSRDAQGRDRAVTGTLTYPEATPPLGGWPVVSTANGTVGLGSQCALSRSRTSAPRHGLDAVAVASDYIGMGPVGEVHAYLSKPSEGRSVIDAVRAARHLPQTGAGDRWLTIGGSQGGHGALSAAELAEPYAPELELLGVVAMAPAAMFDRNYNTIDVLVTRVVTLMALYGAATEDPAIDPRDYLHPDVADLAEPALASGCTGDVINAVAPLLGSPDFWTNEPKDTEPARTMMMANDVGGVRLGFPALLVQGTADTTVFPARTEDLFARMCGVGQVTEYLEVEGAGHSGYGPVADAHMTDWMVDRLEGAPAPDSCPTG